VDDVMVRALVVVAHDATLATAWSLMRSERVRHLPVLDAERRLVGILTERDVRQTVLDPALGDEAGTLASALGRLRVNEVMTWAVITVPPRTALREAARIMHERKVGALVVAERGRAAGMLTATDVVDALISAALERRGARARDRDGPPLDRLREGKGRGT
jgi:acetoin utilization protein AcuB